MVLLRSCRHLKTIVTMSTMRTLLLAALCCVCLALPFPRLQRKRRDTGDEAPGTQKKQSWFDKVYEANNETVIVGGYIIRNLDIASRIGRSDILPSTQDSQCQHNICLWPKSSDGFVYIPYSLSSDFGSYGRMVIAASLSDMEAATCIRFRPKTSEADYISFQPTVGCWSSLGITGGAQTISLDPSSCLWSGIVTHEVLHALGLNHEHVRSDRDSYVQVQWNNIQSGAKSNFDITNTYNLDLTDYDYESVMHYTNTAFSVNGQPTLIPIPDNTIELGNYFSMSDLDIIKINTLYKCAATLKAPLKITTRRTTPATTTKTTTTTTTTKRTPSTTTTTTKAPTTTTTTASTTRTTTTKSTTTTTTNKQTTRTTTTTSTTTTAPKTILNGCGGNLTAPEGVFASPNFPNDYPNNANCHWNITTNTQFRVTFTDFDIESENYDCLFDKLRIYNGIGFNVMYQLTDLCGQNLPSPITSYGSSMQFVFISDPSIARKGFRVVYSPI